MYSGIQVHDNNPPSFLWHHVAKLNRMIATQFVVYLCVLYLIEYS